MKFLRETKAEVDTISEKVNQVAYTLTEIGKRIDDLITEINIIHAVCPKCGYNINQGLNLEQWQKFLKKHR